MKTRVVSSLFACFFLFQLCSNAQVMFPSWAKTAGGTSNDEGTCVVADQHGAVYVAGTFKSSSFTIGTATLINAGGNDIFLAKFDTAGNFLWAQRYGGTESESVSKMIMHTDGTIFLSDTFSTTISIAGNSFAPGGGSSNIYFAKLDNSGVVQWVNTISGSVYYPDLAVDSHNALYVSGANSVTNEAFFNKYNSSGAIQNSKSLASSFSARQRPLVAIDRQENVHFIYHQNLVYVTRNLYDSTGVLLGTLPLQSNQPNYFLTGYKALYPNTYNYAAAHVNLNFSWLMYLGNASGFENIAGCINNVVNTGTDHLGNHFGGGNYQHEMPPLSTCAASGYTLFNGSPTSPNIFVQGSTASDIFYTRRNTSSGIDALGSTKNNGYTQEYARSIAVDTAGQAVYMIGSWSKLADTSKFYFGNSTLVNAGNGITTDMLLLKFRYASNALSLNAGNDRTICPGGSVIIGGTAAGGSGNYSYSWSPAAGLSNASVATPTASPTTTTDYVVTVTDGSGASVTDTVKVTVDPSLFVPVISIGLGSNPFCEGSSVTLVTTPAATSYLWNDGQTTSNITVSTNDTVTVTVVNAAGCIGTSASYITTVTPKTATPTIQNSGSAAMCQGESRTLTAQSSQSPATYLWSNGATTQSINVTSAGTYSVQATGPNGCQSLAASVAISVNALPTGSIAATGNTTFCNGDSVLMTATTASGNSVLWNNGSTATSIWVKIAGTYSATITSPQGCSITTNSIGTTVVQIPQTPTINSSGPTSFCSGGSVTLTAQSIETGINYFWSTGATTTSITVSASGIYSVGVLNSSGCVSAPASVTITVNQVPPVPIVSASGPLSFCNGGSVTLTAQNIQSGVTYLWSNGATTSSINVTTGGTYSVKAINANGCSSASSPGTIVVVNSIPTGSISATGSTTICAGDSVQLALTTAPGNTIAWSTGATTSTIWVKNAGNYSAQITSPQGCTLTTNSIAVTVTPLPVPVISQSGNVLTVTPAAQSYQWFYEGTAIPGATAQSYTITQGGTYSVTVTNNGCSASESWSAVQRTATEGIVYQVYPNPSVQDINVVYTLTETQRVTVRLFDMEGKRVFTIVDNQLQNAGDHFYKLRNSSLRLGPGFYVMTIDAGDKKVRQRVIVL